MATKPMIVTASVLLIALLGSVGYFFTTTSAPLSDCERWMTDIASVDAAESDSKVPIDSLLVACEQAVADFTDDPHHHYLYGKALTFIADYETAAGHFRQAAEAHHHPAQHEFGLFHLYNLGAQYDPVAARVWLQRAAEGGYAPAQHQLAEMYFSGERRRSLTASTERLAPSADRRPFKRNFGKRFFITTGADDLLTDGGYVEC